jgi:SAM-dependent MidA family methyltransferase
VPHDELSPLALRIRSEIEAHGPISFERYMELALYAPGLGYYVRGRDPFGVHGDFYTAEQIQPVFGILIAQFIATLKCRAGDPAGFRVVELGAGRAEMAAALAPFGYTAVEAERGAFPERLKGVVLANEFFDALPVRVAVRRDGVFREMRVGFSNTGFVFLDGPPCDGPMLEYLERYYRSVDDGAIVEVHLRGLEWIGRIAQALDGFLVVIDYGYTAREWIRYSSGTLMSYVRHTASEDVLARPGERDITSHVPFTVFEKHAQSRGFSIESFVTLARFLLETGEADQFAAALQASGEKEAVRRRMQLKTLLYGMGETFRVLVAKSATQ